MNPSVKITVLRREYYQDLADRYLVRPQTGPCGIYTDGQTFRVTRENYDSFLEENRFCPSAWDILKHKIYAALQGGSLYWEGWMKDRNTLLVCCDDGARPVVFLLEREAG